MTAYIANHQKKRNNLKRKKLALIRLLERQATEEIMVAAEAVREAQIAVIKLEIYLIPPAI